MTNRIQELTVNEVGVMSKMRGIIDLITFCRNAQSGRQGAGYRVFILFEG